MTRILVWTRSITAIAVVFTALGAVLMLVVGAATTVRAAQIYLGGTKLEAFGDEAALKATIEMVSSLDQFLLAIVLLIFAFGVFRLFIAPEGGAAGLPDWLMTTTVTDLKTKLLETIAILLAVLFLKSALDVPPNAVIPWSVLVVPLAVGIFSASVWLIRRSGH